MGKVKRLELWWQLYLYATSGSGLRKKPAITLCAFECTIWLFAFVCPGCRGDSARSYSSWQSVAYVVHALWEARDVPGCNIEPCGKSSSFIGWGTHGPVVPGCKQIPYCMYLGIHISSGSMYGSVDSYYVVFVGSWGFGMGLSSVMSRECPHRVSHERAEKIPKRCIPAEFWNQFLPNTRKVLSRVSL
jgi:hypothetical protein